MVDTSILYSSTGKWSGGSIGGIKDIIDAILSDAIGICGMLPKDIMDICPVEFEIIRDSKIKLLQLQNPYLAPNEEPTTKKQSQEEHMQTITMANSLMDGDS